MMAKQLLDRKGTRYNDIPVDNDPAKRQEMTTKSRQRTVPQIFINDKSIGGYTDLLALDRAKKLDSLLAES
ncbi:UNVERIFIED_CONTAM: hypothetical protein GTU68_062287 [Idotea baltica]|nr:hypothetical protein [Idotea baltica]